MRQCARLSAAVLALGVALSLGSGGVASAWSGDGGGPSWSLVDRGQKEDKAPKAKSEHPGKTESARTIYSDILLFDPTNAVAKERSKAPKKLATANTPHTGTEHHTTTL